MSKIISTRHTGTINAIGDDSIVIKITVLFPMFLNLVSIIRKLNVNKEHSSYVSYLFK